MRYVGDAEIETIYEVWQDDSPVAWCSGPQEQAWQEALHYAAEYSQDGPVELYEVFQSRRKIDLTKQES